MNYFKNFVFWFINITYFEFIFSFFSYDTYAKSIVINIFIFSLMISAILSFITGLFKEKTNNIIKCILNFIFGFHFSLQYIFHSVFQSYFSFSLLGLSDQLTSFTSDVINAIVSNIFIVVLFFIPFILNIILRKKIIIKRYSLCDLLFNALTIIASISLLFINIYVQKNNQNSIYELLFKVNSNSLNIEKMGVLPSVFIDIKRAIFGFEVEFENVEEEQKPTEYGYNILDINFKDTNNNNIKRINEYIESLSGTQKNEYTGIFEGYNLIYITAESFSQIGIREDLTPTLYKLTNSGFVFNNFYTPNNLSTIGGEFQSITGLYANGQILSKWRSGTNYFPFGLSTVFEKNNYATFAYHNNTYSFQDRHKYLKSLGFDNYLGCSNGLEKLINCKLWPQSDVEMVNATMDYYLTEQPFLAYYMTVSGHLEYNFFGNAMAKKHKDEVDNLNYSTAAKAYLATQIELDRALESLINNLEKKGILDKTVIVLQADHYPYKLSLSDINSLSTYKRDSVVEVNHNSLIIWNPNIEKTEIDKACMSIDVIPTIYNLFGIEYDSRLFVGNDIFSNKEGLAIMANRSWVSDYGTYYANSSKFVSNGKDIPDGYVEKINAIVNNRMNISKLIIETNYYDHLFREN